MVYKWVFNHEWSVHAEMRTSVCRPCKRHMNEPKKSIEQIGMQYLQAMQTGNKTGLETSNCTPHPFITNIHNMQELCFPFYVHILFL